MVNFRWLELQLFNRKAFLGVPTEVLALGFESVFFAGVFFAVLAVSPFCPSFGPLPGGVGENARRALPSRLSLLKRVDARKIVFALAETEN